MSNDGNVDSVEMCLKTHVRNHDISLLKYLEELGGHPGESGAILPEISSRGQHQMLGKAAHAGTANSSRHNSAAFLQMKISGA
jgi:hypothetical protein